MLFLHRVVEQDHLLRDHPHHRPQRLEVDLADVGPVDQYPAGRRIVEPRYEIHERGLPGAARPDERDDLAAPDGEADVLEHRPSGNVLETHGIEADLRRCTPRSSALREHRWARLDLHDREHAVRARETLLDRAVQLAQVLHRRHDPDHRAHEEDEVLRREPSRENQVPAVEEDDDDGERPEELGGRRRHRAPELHLEVLLDVPRGSASRNGASRGRPC